MNVISFDDFEKSFQSVAGLASVDALDKFFLVQTLNLRLRDAWSRAKWPELTSIQQFPLSASPQGTYSTAQVTQDILNVYDFHPWEDYQARVLNYTLLDGRIVVNPKHGKTSVYVLAKKNFVPYTENSTDIPAFFENYLVHGCLAEFFRGDSQYDKANSEEALAEEYLLRQIDRVEKAEQQNSPTVNQYKSSTNAIYQTT